MLAVARLMGGVITKLRLMDSTAAAVVLMLMSVIIALRALQPFGPQVLPLELALPNHCEFIKEKDHTFDIMTTKKSPSLIE